MKHTVYDLKNHHKFSTLEDDRKLAGEKIPHIWVVVLDHKHIRVYSKKDHGLIRVEENLPKLHENYPAQQINHWLEKMLESGNFDRLILSAPPKYLGDLRKTISTKVASHIVAEINKDLSKMSESDIEAELKKIIWFLR